MDDFFRSTWVAVIGFTGIAILSAAVFAVRHGKIFMAYAL